jgi:hypothetical protein
VPSRTPAMFVTHLFGLMHLVNGMEEDVTDIIAVDIPGEIFNKTFIRHMMLGTGEASRRNERVHALHENHAEYRFNGTRYRGDADIYRHGTMKYLTNLKNQFTMNMKGFMIRSIFALYPGLSRRGTQAIIDGIANDSKNEQKIEFVDDKTSRRRKNEASVIRAAIKEHRAVLGLVNPAEKLRNMKKDDERCYPLILRYFVFLERELERMLEMTLNEEENEESQKWKAVLMENRFDVVPLCNIKSHFVAIDSSVLHGMIREICPEFDVSRKENSSENRETYWKNILDFKRLKTSKQKVFTGLIETDGVTICGHYRMLMADRPGPSSISSVTKHEIKKEMDPATQQMQENDFRCRP